MRHVRFLAPNSKQPKAGVLQNDLIVTRTKNYPLNTVRLLAPSIPTKIICLGRNYAAHAQELGNEVPDRPMFFFKPPSAVIATNDEIVLPPSSRVDYEAELAVVIGKQCRNVQAKRVMDVILGYTCMNDVSNRETQKWEKNWVRAKGFDTSAPLGPVIVTPDEMEEPFHVTLCLNGTIKQDGWTRDLIFSIPEIIGELTTFMTLEPGDVIATGTPTGVGPLSHGDFVEVEIEGIGVLRNRVRAGDRPVIAPASSK
jgi:2-keto-4-pentenoate hydratase/2-oxohepta-3-ene-1,7-dioic acid hydratase in catechol pathway